MLSLDRINEIAYEAASAALKGTALSNVSAEPTIDSDGREALLITVVLGSVGKPTINGDSALDAIVRIQRDLESAGEERFPIVDFATDDEMSLNGSP